MNHAWVWGWTWLAIVLLVTIIVRVRLLDVPLERDEGEFAYQAQLMLEGVPPYRAAYAMKWPGIYAAYSAFVITFGETTRGVHLGLLLCNIASIVFLYLLARRSCDPITSALAAGWFASLALTPQLLGTTTQAESVYLPAIQAGAWFVEIYFDSRKLRYLIVGGLLLGVAITVKQNAAFLVSVLALYFVAREIFGRRGDTRNVSAMLVGLPVLLMLPMVGVVTLCWIAGVHSQFWFWTVTYATDYATQVTPADAWRNWVHIAPRIFSASKLLWCLAAAGLVSLTWDRAIRKNSGLWLAWLVGGCFVVLSGFHFRPHYFIPLLPAVAVFAAYAISSLAQAIYGTQPQQLWRAKFVLGLLFYMAVCWSNRHYLFVWHPYQVSRAMYGQNPFIESVQVADYIRLRTGSDDRIAILGSEPQIYFYANRRAASPHIYMYPLMESQPWARAMQRDLIDQLKATTPTYLVVVNSSVSWGRRTNSNTAIVSWLNEFTTEQYRLVGIVDIPLQGPTVYRWGGEIGAYRPESNCWLAIYRHKS